MSTVSFDLPEDALIALKLDSTTAAAELRLAAAAKLFELGRLSSGAAARVAGLERIDFLQRLSALGVAVFDMSEGDVEKDAESA